MNYVRGLHSSLNDEFIDKVARKVDKSDEEELCRSKYCWMSVNLVLLANIEFISPNGIVMKRWLMSK